MWLTLRNFNLDIFVFGSRCLNREINKGVNLNISKQNPIYQTLDMLLKLFFIIIIHNILTININILNTNNYLTVGLKSS